MTTTFDEAAVFGLDRPNVSTATLADRFDPRPDEYLDDPVSWVDERLGEFTWSKQDEIMESVVEHRHTAVPSAHGPGKSWTGARVVAWWLDVHPEGEAFAVTTAPTFRQVQAILWREIRRAKRHGDLPGRTTLDCSWYRGGTRIGHEDEELVAFGRKPADYDQEAFQGIHAKYVLVVMDEASGIPKLLYDAVDSLVTNESARVLAIGNPDDPASEFARVCSPGSGWNVIPISVFDTPAFTGEAVPEDLLNYLPSKTWVDERKKRWGESSPIYQSKVLGRFPDIGEDTLIAPRVIREAQEEIDLSSGALKDQGQYGVDVARFGSNKTTIYRCRAGVIRKEYEGGKTRTTAVAGRVKSYVEPSKGKIPAVIDADGIGGGVVDILHEERVRSVVPFHGGAAAYDKERFINRRAEAFWTFKEAMERGAVDLDPNDDDLAAQLGAIKWKLDSKGRIQIESKEDMAKRGVASPDHADGAVLSWLPGARVAVDSDPSRAGRKKPDNSLTGDLLDKEI